MNSDTPSILIVDDEADSCRNLADILGELGGYQVKTAFDGDSALELVRQRRFDVAILDLMMPGMDGAALYEQMKRLCPGTVALLLTAHPAHPRAEAALAAGVWRLLAKPADMRQLLELVETSAAQPLILVVDDDADLCASLWDVLRDAGYRVCLAHDVASACERVQANGYKFVLADLRLPDGEGTQVVRLTRQAKPTCGVVVITGYGTELVENVHEAVAAGASAVLHKPIDVPALLDLLRELTGK